MQWQWQHDAKRPLCDTNKAHQIANRTTSGPIQSLWSNLAHLLSMYTTHAVSCSGNGGDQKQAASTLINTAQKIASQLTPAPTPTPTPQANFLNLPNIGNLQNLLGALPGNQVCVQSGNGVHGRCLNRSILALACIASWAAHATMAQLGLNDQRLLSLSFGCLNGLCAVVFGTTNSGEHETGTSAGRCLYLIETIHREELLRGNQAFDTVQKTPQAQVQAQAQPQAQAQYTAPAAPNNPLANLMHFQEQQPSQQQQEGTSDVPPTTQVSLPQVLRVSGVRSTVRSWHIQILKWRT